MEDLPLVQGSEGLLRLTPLRIIRSGKEHHAALRIRTMSGEEMLAKLRLVSDDIALRQHKTGRPRKIHMSSAPSPYTTSRHRAMTCTDDADRASHAGACQELAP